jgi:hypothetical protein
MQLFVAGFLISCLNRKIYICCLAPVLDVPDPLASAVKFKMLKHLDGSPT